MAVKISPKQKEAILVRQGNSCQLCGKNLRNEKTHFHEIADSGDMLLPALDPVSKDVPINVKALCEPCHYERDIEEKVSKLSSVRRKISKEAGVVVTGGMTISVKEPPKPPKKIK